MNGYFFVAGVLLLLCNQPLLAFCTWALGGIAAI